MFMLDCCGLEYVMVAVLERFGISNSGFIVFHAISRGPVYSPNLVEGIIYHNRLNIVTGFTSNKTYTGAIISSRGQGLFFSPVFPFLYESHGLN